MINYIIYTTVLSLFVLTSLIWLVVALFRRSPSRKIAGAIFAVEALVLVIFYLLYFTPRRFPRNYLTGYPLLPATLTQTATQHGFYIGAAINRSANPTYAELVPREFNSITPENATKCL